MRLNKQAQDVVVGDHVVFGTRKVRADWEVLETRSIGAKTVGLRLRHTCSLDNVQWFRFRLKTMLRTYVLKSGRIQSVATAGSTSARTYER